MDREIQELLDRMAVRTMQGKSNYDQQILLDKMLKRRKNNSQD
jgi:hypothetical protein